MIVMSLRTFIIKVLVFIFIYLHILFDRLSDHGIVGNGAFGNLLFVHQIKPVVPVKAYIGLLVGFQIRNHALIVAKLQHGTQQFTGEPLALGLFLNRKII